MNNCYTCERENELTKLIQGEELKDMAYQARLKGELDSLYWEETKLIHDIEANPTAEARRRAEVISKMIEDKQKKLNSLKEKLWR